MNRMPASRREDSYIRNGFTRRAMLQVLGLNLLGLGFGGGFLTRTQAAERGVAGSFAALNRFPRMVQEYFVERLRLVELANHKAKAALKTRPTPRDYVKGVREEFRPVSALSPRRLRSTRASPAWSSATLTGSRKSFSKAGRGCWSRPICTCPKAARFRCRRWLAPAAIR